MVLFPFQTNKKQNKKQPFLLITLLLINTIVTTQDQTSHAYCSTFVQTKY